MSDYINKSALMKYLRDYKWEFALGSDFSKAIEMVDVQPTLDEKEIIRKTFERVVERLEENIVITWEHDYLGGKKDAFMEAIEIIKEEGGIE